jgi:hypothetical protein
MTYRGTVQTKNDGTFSVCMQTEDKKFNVRFDEDFEEFISKKIKKEIDSLFGIV